MRAIGSKTAIKFCQEESWGTTPVSPTAVHGLNVRSINLGGSKNTFKSETINPYRATVGIGDGNKSVQGNIVTDLLPEGLEILIRQLLGKGTVTTTGSGPYTHILKGVADTLEGLSIEKAFTNIGKYFKYSGCRVNSMNIDIVQEGFHGVTWDMVGKAETVDTSTQITGSATYPSKSGFTGYECTVKTDHAISGTFVALGNVTTGSIAITNDVETDGFVLGSQFRASAEYQMRGCSGSFETFFEDTELYELFQAGTECGIQFVFDNGTDSITFEFPIVKLGGDSPSIDSPSGINLPLTFEARYDTSEATDVKVTIVNSSASIELQADE